MVGLADLGGHFQSEQSFGMSFKKLKSPTILAGFEFFRSAWEVFTFTNRSVQLGNLSSKNKFLRTTLGRRITILELAHSFLKIFAESKYLKNNFAAVYKGLFHREIYLLHCSLQISHVFFLNLKYHPLPVFMQV